MSCLVFVVLSSYDLLCFLVSSPTRYVLLLLSFIF